MGGRYRMVLISNIKKTPERLTKHLARKITKTYEEENNEILENCHEVQNYKEIEDHKEAKKVMKEYLKTVIEEVKKNKEVINKTSKTNEIINRAKEILNDPKFQKGIRSLTDEDARVVRKKPYAKFFRL